MPFIFLRFLTIRVSTLPNPLWPSFAYFVTHSVHGPPKAASDASKAPARPDLPAACATAQGSPVHFCPAALPGSALDPQVHCSCHHLPCHGEFMTQNSNWHSHLELIFKAFRQGTISETEAHLCSAVWHLVFVSILFFQCVICHIHLQKLIYMQHYRHVQMRNALLQLM